MSRNGSGVYTLPSNGFKPAVSGQSITASDWNQTGTDLEAAITASIATDGQTTTTARIPFAKGASAFAGSAASVSYSFSSDPNTGIYSPAADKLGVVVGGTELLRAESGQFSPRTNNAVDLGASSLRFKDGYFAGGLTLGAPLPVTSGGTGASTASSARTNLGLAIGTNVQAYNSNLTAWAGKTAPTGDVVGTSDSQTLTSKTLTSPVLNTGVSGTAIKDEDDMASDSATHLATQQSIKAYVDGKSVVVDRAYDEQSGAFNATSVIPDDASIPQITEGDEILSASITPKKNTNRIRATVHMFCNTSAGTINGIAAMFVNSGADAVNACGGASGNTARDWVLSMQYEYVPGSTSAQTISVRVGPSSSGTMTVNPAFSTASKATLVLEEINA